MIIYFYSQGRSDRLTAQRGEIRYARSDDGTDFHYTSSLPINDPLILKALTVGETVPAAILKQLKIYDVAPDSIVACKAKSFRQWGVAITDPKTFSNDKSHNCMGAGPLPTRRIDGSYQFQTLAA